VKLVNLINIIKNNLKSFRMNNSRLQQLLDFYKEDPNDPFIIYALATEYLKTDEKTSLEFYLKLTTEHANYVATYYHLGKLYEKMTERNLAEQTYKKGIEIAKAEKQQHALSELQQAYNEMMYEE
jgi:uncharacterized protein HemY